MDHLTINSDLANGAHKVILVANKNISDAKDMIPIIYDSLEGQKSVLSSLETLAISYVVEKTSEALDLNQLSALLFQLQVYTQKIKMTAIPNNLVLEFISDLVSNESRDLRGPIIFGLYKFINDNLPKYDMDVIGRRLLHGLVNRSEELEGLFRKRHATHDLRCDIRIIESISSLLYTYNILSYVDLTSELQKEAMGYKVGMYFKFCMRLLNISGRAMDLAITNAVDQTWPVLSCLQLVVHAVRIAHGCLVNFPQVNYWQLPFLSKVAANNLSKLLNFFSYPVFHKSHEDYLNSFNNFQNKTWSSSDDYFAPSFESFCCISSSININHILSLLDDIYCSLTVLTGGFYDTRYSALHPNFHDHNKLVNINQRICELGYAKQLIITIPDEVMEVPEDKMDAITALPMITPITLLSSKVTIDYGTYLELDATSGKDPFTQTKLAYVPKHTSQPKHHLRDRCTSNKTIKDPCFPAQDFNS